MSAEKGLAWFDLGDGRIIKGRAFWFNAELPDKWEGREYLMQLERFERDTIGLSEWVDGEILEQEHKDSLGKKGGGPRPPPHNGNGGKNGSNGNRAKKTLSKSEELPAPDDGSPFKLDLSGKGGRPRGMVRSFTAPPALEPKKEAAQKSEATFPGTSQPPFHSTHLK